jgi:hypothetical protein
VIDSRLIADENIILFQYLIQQNVSVVVLVRENALILVNHIEQIVELLQRLPKKE